MIYFVGDVHGRFKDLVAKLESQKISDSFIMQVGDFGVGFKRKNDEELELKLINQFLKTRNNKFFAIRGNHDDPSYFEKDQKYGNITLLKDYSLIEIEDQKILLIGGAVSIDRTDRVEGSSYWKTEGFEFRKSVLNILLEGIGKLDIVVTHNAPSEFWPHDFNNEDVQHFIKRDKNLLGDLVNERNAHTDLLKHLHTRELGPRFWYYGHYHTNYSSNFNGIKYRILNELEVRQHFKPQ